MAKDVKPKTEKIRGRPKKQINWGTFEFLCSIQCTMTEIAGALFVDVDTLQTHCKANYGRLFSEVYKEFSANGLASLRRAQWDQAVQKRDTTLLKHLSKNHLGMTDRVDQKIEHTGNIQTSSNDLDSVKKIHSDPIASKLALALGERMLELEEQENKDG